MPDRLARCTAAWFRPVYLYGLATGGPVALAELLLCMAPCRAQDDVKFRKCNRSDDSLFSGHLGHNPVVLPRQSIPVYPQSDRGQDQGLAQR